MVDCFLGLAGAAANAGQPERAARLFGATEALRESIHIGPAVSYPDRVEYDRYVAAVRAQLDDAAFAATWAEGRELTLEQAIEYALSESEIPADTSTPPSAQELREKFGGGIPLGVRFARRATFAH